MDIQPLEILKWIGIVLAAGFIGYFGRYLAMLILGRLHKKGLEASNVENVDAKHSKQTAVIDDSSYKLEKKKAKQETKRVKKADKM